MQKSNEPEILGIALVICKHPVTKKYLAVHENNDTWWVAGGRVDAPEAFSQGAIRECQQEAGIDVNLKGILRIQQSLGIQFSRLKIVFYAEPKDLNQIPKRIADKESIEAAYFSMEEIVALKSKWRGPQLFEWAKYIEQGGKIHNLSVLSQIQLPK